MKAKHTPGPWSRNIRANGKYPVIFAGRNTHVAMAVQMPDPSETEANISLIAAAPGMLTELRETLHDLTTWDGSPDALEVIRENLRRAIAKATEEGA